MPEPIDLDKMSSDDLAQILDSAREDGSVDIPAPEPEPASVEAEAPPAEEAAPEPEPEPPAPEPELDPRDRRIKELEAHAARLAGKNGFLESRVKALSLSTAPDEVRLEESATGFDDYQRPATFEEIESLRVAREQDQERITRLENEYDAGLHSRAIQTEANRIEAQVGVRPEDQPVIDAAIVRHAELIEEIKQHRDPALIQAAARYLAETVGADILAARSQRMVERKASTAADNTRAKRASAPSGSGGMQTPPPPAKSVSDMSATEADRWLRENVR